MKINCGGYVASSLTEECQCCWMSQTFQNKVFRIEIKPNFIIRDAKIGNIHSRPRHGWVTLYIYFQTCENIFCWVSWVTLESTFDFTLWEKCKHFGFGKTSMMLFNTCNFFKLYFIKINYPIDKQRYRLSGVE